MQNECTCLKYFIISFFFLTRYLSGLYIAVYIYVCFLKYRSNLKCVTGDISGSWAIGKSFGDGNQQCRHGGRALHNLIRETGCLVRVYQRTPATIITNNASGSGDPRAYDISISEAL